MMSLKTTFAVYPKEPTEFFKSHTSELCNLMKRIELTSGISAHIIFFYRLNFYRLNLIPWQLAAGKQLNINNNWQQLNIICSPTDAVPQFL